MSLVLSADWGPYSGALEARACLSRFVDKVCGPELGVVWAANGAVFPLRAPRPDGQGFDQVIIFEWTRVPPPAPKPASGFWPKLKAFIKTCLEEEGKAALAESQANMAMGQALKQLIGKVATTHPDDAAGVALDVLCIGLSLALIPTGLGLVGAIGLVGGAFLLGADTTAYAMELGGDEDGAERFKQATERYRLLATVMTLPDIAYGGVKAVRELQEIKELRAVDRTTAKTAESLAARTKHASRAAEYEQIAERAHLRSQLRTEQIVASFKHEITPRGAGVGSTILLLKEEFGSDESTLHRFLSRLQIHCVAVHE